MKVKSIGNIAKLVLVNAYLNMYTLGHFFKNGEIA
jgi:hypothetical protein